MIRAEGFPEAFMRFVCRSALAVLAVAAAAVAQAQQPPGPRSANQPPPPTQIPADIVPDATRPQGNGAPADWLAEWEDLWKRRADRSVLQRLEQVAEEHLAQDPAGFETNWRKAALVA